MAGGTTRTPWRTTTLLALGGAIGLLLALVAILALAHGKTASPKPRATATPVAKRALAPVGGGARSLDLPDAELAAFVATNDIQRVPFDSTVATIKRCTRRSDDALEACLDAGSRDQACETDTAQCAAAAEQAWQLYIAHYLRLLGARKFEFSPAVSQRAWTAYVDAECTFQSAVFPDDRVMGNVVLQTCLAAKAQARALELRGSVIDAGS